MKEPDRNTMPQTRPFGALTLPQPAREVLPNGLECYLISKGDLPLCRIDLLFDGGRYAAPSAAIAELVGPMMRRGAAGYDSNRIAEELEYYGASMQPSLTQHFSTLSIFTLNRNLEALCPLIETVITQPTFPEAELDLMRQQRKQSLQVNRTKVGYLAGEEFYKLLYGREHPYARTTTAADLDNLTTDLLRQYHREHIMGTRVRAIISGCLDERVTESARRLLGSLPCNKAFVESEPLPIAPGEKHHSLIDKPGALQSAIRMGVSTVTCNHADYVPLQMASLILGGYFGSRLMTNIREEKGYTYGIGSSHIGMRQRSYLQINTETGTEYTRRVIDEVRKELQRMCDEEVGQEEFTTALNYLQGRRARTLDNPFVLADHYFTSFISGSSLQRFDTDDAAYRALTPTDVRRVAARYLQPDAMYVAIAGDREAIEKQ